MESDDRHTDPPAREYVSRAGSKLAAAIEAFQLCVHGLIAADLGSHVGGFVDCLIGYGAARVYSVDTSYGTLAWALRKDERVVVLERTNAIHVTLPEPADLITIDVGWTPQSRILPAAARNLKPGGTVMTLVKPHYEAPKDRLTKGVLDDNQGRDILHGVKASAIQSGWQITDEMESPLRGHGGNREFLLCLRKA